MEKDHFLGFIIIIFNIFGSTFALTPFVTTSPKDTSVLIGQDVTLECAIGNFKPGNLVMWTKGGFALGVERSLRGFPRYSITGDESIGEYNLLIKNSTIEDEDEYECQVTSHRLRTKAARVSIQVPPLGPFIEDMKNGVVNVRANSINSITCRSVNGRPAAHLKWYKDGKEVTENDTYAVTDGANKLYNSSATLRLWPRVFDDQETYQCVMKSSVRTGNEKGETVARTTVLINVQKPPVSQVKLTPSHRVLEGQTISAICDAASSKPPATSYSWYINDKRVSGKDDDRFVLNDIGRNMNKWEIGCRAINEIGESEISKIKLSVLYPPTLVTDPQKLTLNASEKAVFTCEWDSNPQPSVTWYRGDKLLGRGNILTIHSVTQSDAGEITCLAQATEVGENTATTTLTVLGPPSIENLDQKLVELGAKIGIVECEVATDPGIQHINWRWMKADVEYLLSDNGSMPITSVPMIRDENLTEKRKPSLKYQSQFVRGSRMAKLFIYNVKKEDLGQYNCTVTNAFGVDTLEINVKEISTAISPIPMVIAGVIAGVLIVIIAMFCWCKYYRRQSIINTKTVNRSTKNNELQTNQDNFAGGSVHSFSRSQVRIDPDSDNLSTSSSLSTPVGDEEVFIAMEQNTHVTQHDDGYHTEEVSSWNAAEKANGSSPSRRNMFSSEQAVPLLPTVASSPRTTPSVVSRGSEHHTNGSDKQFSTPRSIHKYNGRSQNELDSYTPNHLKPSNPTNSYSSLGRNGVFVPTLPSTPSVVSSHRSASTVPLFTRQYSMEKNPNSGAGNYYSTSPVIRRDSHHVIKPSIEQIISSYAPPDAFDNSSQLSQPSTRLSQSSRSSEMFQRPLQARMATHV